MIHITELTHGILQIPDLTIPSGLTIISGDNGAGKTTLLKLCSGILLPNKGTILINGKTPREIEAGYVSEFPDRHLIFSKVSDEIASPLRFMKKDIEEINSAVQNISEELGILHLLDRESGTLSGGEKMLLGLAAALITSQDLLILDEPDSHLDPETVNEVLELLQSSEVPHILWSSHAKELHHKADTLIRLSGGKIVS